MKKGNKNVSPGIEIIQYKGEMIGLCVRNYSNWEETKFLTAEDSPQQIGLISYEKDHILRAHAHHKITRTIDLTAEVLFCVSGRIVFTFYDEKKNWSKITSCELTKGDLLCVFGSGHGAKALESTRLIEVKQGPYLGSKEKYFRPEE